MESACEGAAGLPEYRGLEILSPMVRGSCLPLRLCCLQYGAGLVYSGVTIDRSILECTRVENAEFGCVDYVNREEGKVIFSTCEEERRHLIFQIGTRDASLATRAALHVCRDVRGIDVNMGCTAPFSTSGGMGAELLEKPDVVADILKSLRRALPSETAVSCKIRMLPTVAQTRDFMQMCERSGANAVAVHMRTPAEDRNKGQPAHWDTITQLCSGVSIPVIANGDFLSRDHIADFWGRLDAANCKEGPGGFDVGPEAAAATSAAAPAALMVARGALWNPAVFSRQEKVPFDDVVRNYIRTAARVNNIFFNTKWALKEMVINNEHKPASLSFAGLQGAAQRRFRARVDNMQSMSECCKLFGVDHDASAYPHKAFALDYGRRLLPVSDGTPPPPPPLPATGGGCGGVAGGGGVLSG